MTVFEELQRAIIDGDAALAKRLAERGLNEGVSPALFFPQAIIPAMDEVGSRMNRCEYFIAEVLLSGRAARTVSGILQPLLVRGQSFKPLGTVALGTVRGDLHDIGKNIVSMLLEAAGFRVLDLGVDVGPQRFVRAVHEQQAGIVAMSALLTTTMLNMKEVIRALEVAGLRDKVKIMVGGAPVTQEWARSIGADGYGWDAPAAVELARRLVA